MKGKKSDPEFISQFIQDCIDIGLRTPEGMVSHAKVLIEEIDDEIKSIVARKITRSKLLDVIESFEKPKKDKTEEAKLLPFYDLKYQHICRDICWGLRYEVDTLPFLNWSSFGGGAAEHNFSVKQLLEAKVLNRMGYLLLRGEKFDDYMKFVLQEGQ